MSPELTGIISVGAALAALFVGLFAWLRGDIKEQGNEIKEQGNKVDEKLAAQSQELTGVKIEVAALRATVETYFRVRVDPPPGGGPDNEVDRAA